MSDDNKDKKAVQTVDGEVKDKQGVLDLVLGKITSRKLLVWLVGTGLLIDSKIEGEQWVWLALCYIGSQACVDFVATLKRAK